MRTKLRNAEETAHVWASQSQSEGRAGNVFFRDSTIYSYGTHFPMARIYRVKETGERLAFFNPCRRSVSTSKQQGYTRRAWDGNGESIRAHTDFWPRSEEITQPEIAAIRERQAQLDEQSTEAEKQWKREQAKRSRNQKKLDAMTLADKCARWQAGDFLPLPWDAPLMLRHIEDGKRVETSRRAVVPTRAALRAWAAFCAGKLQSGETVGSYTVDSITPETVKIGCHVFPVETLRAFFGNPKTPHQ